MATAAVEVEQSASTSIATIVAQTPVVVLVDEKKREQLYEHIQREVEAFEPDVSTPKGRDAIKSLAYKITRTKTAIDAAGKELNEEARAKINAVDAARRDAREKLDAMAKAVRAPLTEWEEAEEKRIEWCREVIQSFKAGAVVTMDDTSETVRERGKRAFEVIIKEETFGDMLAEATAAKEACIETLKVALARLTKEEADRAELERLRQEAAEREAREQAEREEREARERAEAEARAAEERRIAAEKAEAERIERARQEAAEAAKREAEEAAQREREEAERARQAEVDAANERARQAEAEAARQREEAERAERERQAQAEAEAKAQAKREADRAHRGKVMAAAKTAIMTCGADEETAKKIVLAIVAGEVPAVSLRF
jgi:colicin import membrane protein